MSCRHGGRTHFSMRQQMTQRTRQKNHPTGADKCVSGGSTPCTAAPEELLRRNQELIRRNDDLNDLLKRRTAELTRTMEDLRRASREIDEELEMARSVQTSLMPKHLPEFINMKVATAYIPTGKVGGDMFDILITTTRKTAILIYDVSGHGVPAALIGALAKMLFAHYIELLESPALIFREVNRELCSFLKTDHYLTAFLGIYDSIQNSMVYSRAGHVKPLVYHAATGDVTRLESQGFFIGHSAIADVARYDEAVTRIEPGDKMLFYTDGLTEGCNREGTLYGNKRLMNAVRRTGDQELEDFLNGILEDQTRFREGVELMDDFTVLCVQAGDAEKILKESGFTKEDAPNVLSAHEVSDVERVCAIVLRAMNAAGFSDQEIRETKVCVFEMILNAIEHGNMADPDKTVLIFYKITPDRLHLSVVDEGDGYSYARLPDACAPANILKTRGRGIHLVRRFMDEVHVNERGNRILVVRVHR